MNELKIQLENIIAKLSKEVDARDLRVLYLQRELEQAKIDNARESGRLSSAHQYLGMINQQISISINQKSSDGLKQVESASP